MAAGGNQGNTGYSSLHKCCVHRRTAASGQTESRTHTQVGVERAASAETVQATGDCHHFVTLVTGSSGQLSACP